MNADEPATRVVYLGQKPVGERCFELLLERRSERLAVCGAVSNDSPEVWWGTAGVHDRARAQGIAFVANRERNEAEIADLVRRSGANALISVQHPWILSPELIGLVGSRAFNLHNAKLPEYRGYYACNHAILNGDETFTSTVHWMAADVDAGDIAFEETFPIDPGVTAQELYGSAAEAGIAAFERLLECLAAGGDVPRAPARGQPRFYGRDSLDGLREIRDGAAPEEIDRTARAFHFPPFEPAYFTIGGRKLHVIPETRPSGRSGQS